MPYQVRLQAFEGPMDLLLHLIEESQVDIYDIPIAEVTSQYLGYIREAQSLDLDVAMEFLVMAATLMLIKARMLVPQALPDDGGADMLDGDGLDDPREELVQRLLEYRRFREVAKTLAELQENAAVLLSREPNLPTIEARDVPLPASLTIADLFEAFQRVMNAHTEATKPFKRIPRDDMNIGQAMRMVFGRALREGTVMFTGLFEGVGTKVELIAVFLGVLELVRLGKVSVDQPRPFEDIAISIK